ncbi:hypothetical protein [Deferrisoma palaeochoriense]
MKKRTILTLVALAGLALGTPALADSGHGSMKGMKMDDHGSTKMDHSEHMGEDIRETKVNGYGLAYHLIDMKEKMEAMKGMKGMSMEKMDMSKMGTHHLMVYVMGPNGEKVTDAKAGYKIVGPDGTEQKAMCMAMNGGFGADVNFKEKGTYTIKTKIVAGDTTLLDEFTYTVE